jgi:ABC-type multidrug transport system fused ATPase/permease subunit
VYYYTDPEEMLQAASTYAYAFIGISVAQFVGALCGQYSFGVMTERLARRVRGRTLTKMLEMEVGWFDMPSHSAGLLAQQLSTDCGIIQALVGERAITSASQVNVFEVKREQN